MAYELDTTKLKIEGNGSGLFRKGHYAVFFVEMRHGTQKAVSALTRPFLKPEGDQPPTLKIEEGTKLSLEGSTTLKVDMAAVDWDAVNDAIILGQVKEWSFGPVDQATLDDMPTKYRDQLITEANRLYTVPLPQGGVGN